MIINFGLNIFISVLSGILTSGLIFIIIKFIKKIIIPWYQKLIYKGLDISGEWIEIHNHENILNEESVIEIKQTANKIKGEIILSKKNISSNKLIELKSFQINGSFYNNYLNITCQNKNKKQLGTVNYLMCVKSDGRMMEGIETHYDVWEQKIKSHKTNWHRNSEKL